ncbi:MAG: PocR ligand-binding domain-containing protein [Clostridia bacterium]|nr:PocR ligand-binding domain-containing protein [Clostridia bacterium]
MGNEAFKEYKLTDVFDINELQKIQDAFSDATGVASIITDKNGTPITKASGFSFLCEHLVRSTEEGLKRCILSDSIIGMSESEVTIRKCLSAGLIDAGISITVLGKPIGNWMIGQIADESFNEQEMLLYANTIGVNKKEYQKALHRVVHMPRSQFEKICHFLYLNAKMLSQFATNSIVQKEEIRLREKAEKEIKILGLKLSQQQRLKAIGTLAGGVAHEINNPINGIINYSQLVLDMVDENSKISDYMKEIIIESNRISLIAKNLLEFSYVKKNEFKKENIVQLINNTKAMINSVLLKNQISFHTEIDEVSEVTCHQQKIQQVLMNLLTNAIETLNKKYPGYHENKKLIISCRNIELDDNAFIRVTVEDHGMGIDEKIRGELFSPFSAANRTDKSAGLGLLMSYAIMKEHKGDLSYETKTGEYTRFHMDIPAGEINNKERNV